MADMSTTGGLYYVDWKRLSRVLTFNSRPAMVRRAAVRRTNTVEAVPDGDTRGLIVAGIEHAGEEHGYVAR